jgi:hypothetical protein
MTNEDISIFFSKQYWLDIGYLNSIHSKLFFKLFSGDRHDLEN